MLRILKGYCPEKSILDDFDFYEEKDNARGAQKEGNSGSQIKLDSLMITHRWYVHVC
jgi:hypothetical protein